MLNKQKRECPSQEKSTRQPLIDLLIAQLNQELPAARASSSAMNADRAPVYPLLGCDHALGRECDPCIWKHLKSEHEDQKINRKRT